MTGVLSINLARISMISSFDIPGETAVIIEAIQARRALAGQNHSFLGWRKTLYIILLASYDVKFLIF